MKEAKKAPSLMINAKNQTAIRILLVKLALLLSFGSAYTSCLEFTAEEFVGKTFQKQCISAIEAIIKKNQSCQQACVDNIPCLRALSHITLDHLHHLIKQDTKTQKNNTVALLCLLRVIIALHDPKIQFSHQNLIHALQFALESTRNIKGRKPHSSTYCNSLSFAVIWSCAFEEIRQYTKKNPTKIVGLLPQNSNFSDSTFLEKNLLECSEGCHSPFALIKYCSNVLAHTPQYKYTQHFFHCYSHIQDFIVYIRKYNLLVQPQRYCPVHLIHQISPLCEQIYQSIVHINQANAKKSLASKTQPTEPQDFQVSNQQLPVPMIQAFKTPKYTPSPTMQAIVDILFLAHHPITALQTHVPGLITALETESFTPILTNCSNSTDALRMSTLLRILIAIYHPQIPFSHKSFAKAFEIYLPREAALKHRSSWEHRICSCIKSTLLWSWVFNTLSDLKQKATLEESKVEAKLPSSIPASFAVSSIDVFDSQLQVPSSATNLYKKYKDLLELSPSTLSILTQFGYAYLKDLLPHMSKLWRKSTHPQPSADRQTLYLLHKQYLTAQHYIIEYNKLDAPAAQAYIQEPSHLLLPMDASLTTDTPKEPATLEGNTETLIPTILSMLGDSLHNLICALPETFESAGEHSSAKPE